VGYHERGMALWGIKYMDVDEKWWMDIAFRDEAPPVRYTRVGSRQLCDGFDLPDAALLVRKASVAPHECAEWPSDDPVSLGPDRTIPPPP